MFLAVRPPADVMGRLEGLPRPVEAGVRWAAVDTWHVTLRFFARVEAAAVAEAMDGVLPLPPAVVRLGPAVERLNRAVVVPAIGLEPLAAAIGRACAGLGGDNRGGDRPFVGHLTLARVRSRRIRCSLVGHPVSGSFPLAEVELVDSVAGRGQHHHSVVHTWPAPPPA
jgi:2'-5' RNA ligase